MKIKLCGFREEETLHAAIESKCDFIGFIFFDKSSRNISISKATELFQLVPQSISKVAVVVNPEIDFLNQIATKLRPEYIQFHGDESAEFISSFKAKHPNVKTIKVFRVESKRDLDNIKDFESVADLFLFDSKVKGEMGGSGKKFDWKILKDLKTSKECILSGGLNISNLDSAIAESGAKIVDISSGIEEQKGIKSSQKVKELMDHLR